MQQCVASPPQQGGQLVPVVVHQPEDPVLLRLLLLPLVLHKLHRRLLQFEAVNAAGDVEQLLLKVTKVGLDSKSEFPLVVDGMDSAEVFKENRPISAGLSREGFEKGKRGQGEPERGEVLRK